MKQCNCGSSNDKHWFGCALYGDGTNKVVSGVMLSKKDAIILKSKFCVKCGKELSLQGRSKYCTKCDPHKTRRH